VVPGPVEGVPSVTIEGPAGSLALDAEPLEAMMQVLREARGPVALGRLIDAAADCDIELGDALAMVLVLVGAKLVAPAQGGEQAALARPACGRFNAYMLASRTERASVTYLASPVTGGAIELPAHFHDFVAAYLSGLRTPREMAERVLERFGSAGQVSREGRPVESREEALEVLLQFARRLEEDWLPALRRLQIVD